MAAPLCFETEVLQMAQDNTKSCYWPNTRENVYRLWKSVNPITYFETTHHVTIRLYEGHIDNSSMTKFIVNFTKAFDAFFFRLIE